MSVQVNDKKRQDMAAQVGRLRDLGWSSVQLAALFNVSPGTVNTWGRGDSMGTNLQRRELAALHGSPAENVLRIRDLITNYDRASAREADQATRSAAVGALHVADRQRHVATSYKARADNLRTIFSEVL
jgi:ribosome-binding protein aMBF1 (putative translation factor)